VDEDGGLAKNTRRLDLHGLLAESDAHDAAPEVDTGSAKRLSKPMRVAEKSRKQVSERWVIEPVRPGRI
jgi:hypothetical protein